MSSSELQAKPRAILGLMTFGPPGTESSGARVTDLAEFNKCLTTFRESGFSEIDTARIYTGGEQEGFTAKSDYKKLGLSIATKCYPTEPGLHNKSGLRATLEKSLAELQTDSVDIFYLHAPDHSVPLEETLEACNELYKEGKFRQLGLSNYSAELVGRIADISRQNGWVRPSIYQAMYNAITRGIEADLIPICRKNDIDVVIYNPLAGGLLSGRYSAEDLQREQPEGRFGKASLGKMYRDRYFKDSSFQALATIEAATKAAGLSMVETALRWCLHHSALQTAAQGGKDGLLIGASSLAQLKQNLECLERGPLPDEVVKALDAAWDLTKHETPSYSR